jgi:hypothetical protein
MNEMSKLIALLENAHVPYEVRPHWDGTIQVSYPNFENPICDAVCFRGSYGYERGLLEIMGLVDAEEVGDSVEGYLTAVEVFQRIFKHYRYGTI